MIRDPYAVLGITKGASADEIKSAYRKMAKKYHPDLHPDDPQAATKMNEINEAYDMLTHPEKYAGRNAFGSDAYSGRTGYYGSYGGYGSASGGDGYGQRSSDSGDYRRTGYRGAGGWYTDFEGFDFEDLFGFNRYREAGNTNINPVHEAGDTAEMSRAVDLINSGNYAEAARVLMQVMNYARNARWYYLNAIALYGYGDTGAAAEYILKAARMEPENSLYVSLLQKFRQEGQTYYRSSQTFINPFRVIGKVILFFFVLRLIAGLFYLLFGGFAYYLPM
ncbi:MAG: J domain-containing protein [Lachnospiraceae bacterium]|nr:J domain-containing protein [Lachnospiraceae bacterium]